MTARVPKGTSSPAALPQLFIVVDAITGELHSGGIRAIRLTCNGYERPAVPVFTSESDAWEALRGAASPLADKDARERWRVVPLIAGTPVAVASIRGCSP
jgi:hypothetical protein